MTKELLFVDGLTRAGYSLASPLISNLVGVEYFQMPVFVDVQLQLMYRLGAISRDDAVASLALSIDSFIYDRAVGRNLNQRPTDSSSVLRANDYADIVRRSYEPDGQSAIARFISANRMPTFMTHEMVPQIELYFAVCPNTRVVEIVRHPVDVIMSWCIRGWGERHGVDPLAFTPTFTHKGKPVAWMAAAWPDEYLDMAPWDRVICCIASYTTLRNEKLASLSPSELGRVHVISYENLTEDPMTTISGVAKFLGRQVPSNMAALVAREGVTAATGITNRRRKFAELASKTATSSMDRLRAISAQYEAQWSLEPVDA